MGSAIGGVFSGDLLTLFLFWEIAAVSSVPLIWKGGPKAYAAVFDILHFIFSRVFVCLQARLSMAALMGVISALDILGWMRQVVG